MPIIEFIEFKPYNSVWVYLIATVVQCTLQPAGIIKKKHNYIRVHLMQVIVKFIVQTQSARSAYRIVLLVYYHMSCFSTGNNFVLINLIITHHECFLHIWYKYAIAPTHIVSNHCYYTTKDTLPVQCNYNAIKWFGQFLFIYISYVRTLPTLIVCICE